MYNELFINDDEHRWPPSEQLLKAFDWLELEAFRKNQKPINWYDLNKIYEGFYEEAKTSESKAKIEAHLIKVHGYSEEQASKAASWAIDEFDRRKESKENEIATVQKE
jgi:inactivated superfamily I helicase